MTASTRTARLSTLSILAIMALSTFGAPVLAASAVAYGTQSFAVAESTPSREEAVQQALETCSSRDRNCLILAKCEARGFGAVALSRAEGLLQSIAATCAEPDIETARSKALSACNDTVNATCELVAQWQD